jgi:hypothetical protein
VEPAPKSHPYPHIPYPLPYPQSAASGGRPRPASEGFLYAGLLAASALMGALLATQYGFRVQQVALRVRVGLVTQVYAKSLRVSEVRVAGVGLGRVTNLVSMDCDRVMNMANSFHEFW